MFCFIINRVHNRLVSISGDIVNQNCSIRETNSEQIRARGTEVYRRDAIWKAEDALWIFQISHGPDAHQTRAF